MHFLTTRFSPLPSAGLRDLFNQTAHGGLPERVVAQIQIVAQIKSLAAEWGLE